MGLAEGCDQGCHGDGTRRKHISGVYIFASIVNVFTKQSLQK